MTTKGAGLEPREHSRDVLIRIDRGVEVADHTPHVQRKGVPRFLPGVFARGFLATNRYCCPPR